MKLISSLTGDMLIVETIEEHCKRHRLNYLVKFFSLKGMFVKRDSTSNLAIYIYIYIY